jgi:peptidoglycan hydrolase-like protein with peptidoglycan-binding domain
MFSQLFSRTTIFSTIGVLIGLSLSACDYWPPALQHEIEELRADLNDALDERQQLDNDNEELRTQYASLQQEVEEKHRENENLRGCLAQLNTRLARPSTSQRTTASPITLTQQTLKKGTYHRLQLTHPPMKGPKVSRLQRLLRQQGFPIRIDGVYGRDTASAVRGFQRYHGLAADGSVGPETDRVLRRGVKPLKLVRELRLQNPPLKGKDVKQVQRALRRAGQRIAIDGRFGPETDVAVTRFQQKNRLEPDGIVGPTTWVTLVR